MSRGRPASLSDRPIIVGGCYRSGTTLVRHLLHAHPRIFCGPEVKFFRDFFGDYADDRHARLRFFSTARALFGDDEVLTELGAAYVRLLQGAAARAGKPRWADKNPDHVLYLDAWQRLLGDAWCFVHVVRSPLETVASLKEARFVRSVPPTLDGWIETYCRFTRTGLDWGTAHPDRYRCVRYDDLVRQPERSLDSLMSWLGERAVPEQLVFDPRLAQRGLEDPKSLATRGVHRESLDRWTCVLEEGEVREVREHTRDVWQRACAATSAVAP